MVVAICPTCCFWFSALPAACDAVAEISRLDPETFSAVDAIDSITQRRLFFILFSPCAALPISSSLSTSMSSTTRLLEETSSIISDIL